MENLLELNQKIKEYFKNIMEYTLEYKLRVLLVAISTFMIGTINFYNSFSIFSISLYIALLKNKKNTTIYEIILFFSCLKTMQIPILIKLLCLIFFTKLINSNKKSKILVDFKQISIYKFSLLYTLLYFALSIVILLFNSKINIFNVTLELLAAFLIFTSSIMFYKAFRFLLGKQLIQVLDKETIVGLSIYFVMFLTSLNGIFVYGFYLQEVIIFLILEVVAYSFGTIYSGIAGTVLTLPLMIKGGYEVNLSILSLLGIIIGLFKNINKFLFSFLFSATSYLLYLTYSDSLNLSITFLGSLLACQILFLIVPTKEYLKLTDKFNEMIKNSKKIYFEKIKKKLVEELKDKEEKIMNFTDVFKKSLEISTQKDDNKLVIDNVVKTICQNCVNKNECLKDNFYTTYTFMMETFKKINENETRNDIIEFCLKNNCCNGMCLVNQFAIEKRRNVNVNLNKSATYNLKKLFLNYLIDNAQCLRNISNDINTYKSSRTHLEKEIYDKLTEKEIQIVDVDITEDKSRYTINALFQNNSIGLQSSVKNVVNRIIKKKFNYYFEENSDGLVNLIAQEKEKINVDYGIFQLPKLSNTQSGDNYTVLRFNNDYIMLSLADGMGKGTKASSKSKLALQILESLVKLELSEDVMIEMINVLLINNQDIFTTLDICIINLFTGKCKFIKSGCISTYVKRNDGVICIKSKSQPVGVLNNVSINVIDFELEHNDTIVMISDGVIDNINNKLEKEQYLIEEIRKMKFQKAQNYAFKLGTIVAKNNVLKDDMSIIVVNVK